MAKDFGIFLTGDKELDYFLAQLAPKEIRKAVVKATDATINYHVLPDYRSRIEAAVFVETGATRDVAKKRRARVRRPNFGSELFIDRQKVVELRRKRGGRIGRDKARGENFFHPIAIEYGNEHQKPERPLLRSLLKNKDSALAEFRKYLRAVITDIKMPGIHYDRRFKP